MRPIELDLAFWADDRADAERQAHEWAAAERAIDRVEILDARNSESRPKWWIVTVCPEWADAVQRTLWDGLVA
jgi:hypothetical protein